MNHVVLPAHQRPVALPPQEPVELPPQRADVVVVEGYMDVIALHQAGFTGAVAPLGTALTAEHATARKVATIKGLDYSSGKPMTLGVYEAETVARRGVVP